VGASLLPLLPLPLLPLLLVPPAAATVALLRGLRPCALLRQSDSYSSNLGTAGKLVAVLFRQLCLCALLGSNWTAARGQATLARLGRLAVLLHYFHRCRLQPLTDVSPLWRDTAS